ncbi:MAG: PEP-CTERM sorting domain-containing protein [Acidobacteria bacterium]|nr:PEP-CTERM sorting domain-containing protein [Acidobacteriota bacterium]
MNRTIGAGSVVGTIQTDGTTGILGSGNILDWNLILDDGFGSFNNLGPLSGDNSKLLFLSTTNLTATVTQLLFNFGGPEGGVMFQNPYIGSSINYWCMQAGGAVCVPGSFTGEGLLVIFNTARQTSGYSGNEVIGTAAGVPEPASIGLIALGVTALLTRRAVARRKAVTA